MITENFVGIGAYLSRAPGMHGKLKQVPEHFKVEEIPISIPKDENGLNLIVQVQLKNWETNRFVRELAKRLNINNERITFAGTKDKRAITTQYFCIKNYRDLLITDLKDVQILDQFRSNFSLTLGDLLENKFIVTVSNVDEDASPKIAAVLAQLNSNFPNYFGIQRFGTSRPVTHIVGKFIIQQNYREAVRHYIGMRFEYDKNPDARDYYFNTLDAKGTFKIITEHLDYERMMLKHLLEKPDDYKGAIQVLPRTLKMMFVHGYQAYLFNKMVTERLKNYSILEPYIGDTIIPVKDHYPDPDRTIAVDSTNIDVVKTRILEKKGWISAVLYGHESKFSAGIQGEIEKKVIEEENISKEMFKIPGFKELSSKGYRRAIHTYYKNLSYNLENNNVTFQFQLLKGNYATSLLRELMKQDDIYYF